MNRKELLQFKDDALFAQLEDQAIDGQLDYNDYPPEEYRYFSKLSKLGYSNRHKGWSKEVCELKQEEYRAEYRKSCAIRSERFRFYSALQARLIRSAELSRMLHAARSKPEALDAALRLLAYVLNDSDLICRIQKNLKEDS